MKKTSIGNFTGAIFDIDDTLLDNLPNSPEGGLHERSRLAAVHKAGEIKGIESLKQLSYEENLMAFKTAAVHSMDGAVWNILQKRGLAEGEAIDQKHEILSLIVELKNTIHEEILIKYGAEVPGASRFVKKLAQAGLADRMAIASTGMRRDIDIFLNKFGIASYFPNERIVSREMITRPKPDPQAYEMAYAMLGLDATAEKKKVLAFEDDPRGVKSAKLTGLYTCAITTRYSRRELLDQEYLPDLVAESFAEYEEIFGL